MTYKKSNKTIILVWMIMLLIGKLLLAQSSSFFMKLPYNWTLGSTSQSEVNSKGKVDASYDQTASDWMYKIGRKNIFAYVTKNDAKLNTLKIWKMPKHWKERGVYDGMPKDKLLTIIRSEGYTPEVNETPYDYDVLFYHENIRFWSSFPKSGKQAGKLEFIVIGIEDKVRESVQIVENTPPEIVIYEPEISRGVRIVSQETLNIRGRAIDNDGIARVEANGIAAQVNSDGYFSISIPVFVGENSVMIKATDAKLESTFKSFSIRRQTAVAVRTPTKEKRLALIIGNAEYTFGGNLANPVNDAGAMEGVLKNLGFTVIRYENCSQKSMKRAMDEFGRQLENYDVGLFFYAGHGVQVNGNNYLIPSDAKLENENDVEYDCVRADRILAKMESARSGTNIVILDACRDNPFERSWHRGAKGSGLAFMNAPSGSLIAYATSPGNTASDGAGKNGIYTSALLEHINSPDITILEMFQRVRSNVMEQSGSRQIPWESTSLRGNFYFKK